jgi:NADPH:quinone reductase-like Zn-dependent oxidoreductase
VFDLIGGDTQTRSFAVLKNGGALISTLQQPDKDKAKEKNLRTAHYMTEADAKELNEIGDLLRCGRIKPTIFATFPLAEAARAENLLDKGHIRGKVVLTIPQDDLH